MKYLKELEISEMIEISGGSKAAYDLGYALGSAIKRVALLFEITRMFS
jgi:hypothetical protein